jgi:hypothetical protein
MLHGSNAICALHNGEIGIARHGSAPNQKPGFANGLAGRLQAGSIHAECGPAAVRTIRRYAVSALPKARLDGQPGQQKALQMGQIPFDRE